MLLELTECLYAVCKQCSHVGLTRFLCYVVWWLLNEMVGQVESVLDN